ncbi:reverse transcriptase-like protein [Pradoshia sp.]|uniref:reverse transcriptase-like protein n=1 Tax=Pradoshia sp. TaxID=2651281 RepID=UPI003EFE831A
MKVTLKWNYTKSKLPSVLFTSEEMDSETAVQIAADLEKIGRAKEMIFIDEIGQEWTKKQFLKLTEKTKEDPHEFVVYFDGSHVPGETSAGAGVVIYYKQNGKIFRARYNERFDQIEDNNEAEYCALYAACLKVEEMGARHQRISLKGDSQVVLNQLSGEWPCFDEALNKWLDRIENKLRELGLEYEVEPVQRKANEEAHRLAQQALQGTSINSVLEVPAGG